MSGKFVRASSYRHVFGTPCKPADEFNEIRSTCSGDGNFICANDKFFAYSTVGGGGPVVVHPLNKPGRLSNKLPLLAVHRDVVLDFQFNPFVSTIIATGGEDCSVKVSQIPEGGMTETINEAYYSLDGHERKITTIQWHPTASGVLATGSADSTVRVWDVEKQAQAYAFSDFGDTLQHFEWNSNGSQIVTTSKDQMLRVFDPRSSGAVSKTHSFTGSKGTRALFQGDKDRIIAVGASKTSARQYGLWDLRNMEKPLVLNEIDTAAGAMIPFYDADNSILYLAGKGDGNIRYFEITDSEPYVHYLSEFRDTKSQKGICWLPKRSCDTHKTEIAVALRMMGDRVQPVSFSVPRKNDLFQKDLYPDAYAGVPTITAGAYFAGQNGEPKKISMNPANKGQAAAAAAASAPAAAAKPMKTVSQLEKELADAHAKIAQLEAELAKLKH